MAKYVVDASVVIEYLIEGPSTPQARAYFNQMNASDTLVVPEFCLLESTNVIWKRVRFNGMPRDRGHEILRTLRAMKLERAPTKDLLERSLEIGLNYSLAIYDSNYIALALHHGYPLITLDQPQSRAAIAEGVIVKPLSDFMI